MRRRLFGEIAEGGQKIRRSLFSTSAYPKRRKLFSNISKVCQDCGEAVSAYTATCPNCGGDRFNYQETTNEETISKTFSNIRNQKRRSLFCDSQCCCCEEIYVCQDCGHEFQGKLSDDLRCPNCGGNRVVKRGGYGDAISCDEFPETCDATGEALKEFSGKSGDFDQLQKEFTDRGLDLNDIIDQGYAQYNEDDNTVCFSENADALQKLFSRLVISVTKELELDPVDSKEALIRKLEDSPTMPSKAIILIKKAHGILPVDSCCQETPCEYTNYIKDSGLENDLKLVHGGQVISLSDLNNIIKSQYNDAPDDIIDKIVRAGFVNISGSSVRVNN